jgi:hypothetical protein
MTRDRRVTTREGRATVASHRQQTQAKAARERLVRERRALKQEKKRATAAERTERAVGDPAPAECEREGV